MSNIIRFIYSMVISMRDLCFSNVLLVMRTVSNAERYAHRLMTASKQILLKNMTFRKANLNTATFC